MISVTECIIFVLPIGLQLISARLIGWQVEADKAVIGQDAAASKALLARERLALIDCEDANNNTPLSEAAGISLTFSSVHR